ncbi:two-component system cell cycle response regulator DivK [Sphingobacterium paludis]|uniref:Two-component system cell cycle response regulator DivK n=2 Tax=Sphingobacterium paludis TaxID=1476465 RepID=A0A4R7D8U9_9SPHI|nr:two-component system cell cycle response regulator DivK [Sphingobacterium paludis]
MRMKKILICDDDFGIVNMLELMLEDIDAEVISETDSSKIFDRLQEEQPDLFIVDLWMPVVTGDESIRYVRSQEKLKDTFVLCISASRNGYEVALEAGANVFLAKPFDMDEFLNVLQDALQTAP